MWLLNIEILGKACVKASQRVKSVGPSFKVEKDYADDDLFEGSFSALKVRTRVVNSQERVQINKNSA